MKADFSRLRVDDVSGDEWLQQQGRVWLDSDWNEAALARLRRLEHHVRDLVGRRGRPAAGRAFQLGDGGNGVLTIGGGAGVAGRFYLDGLQAANPAPTTYTTQPDYPNAPPLPLPTGPATGWELVGDLAAPRAGHGSALVHTDPDDTEGHGIVLVCGGTVAGAATATAELFHPDTALWSGTGAMTSARTGHSVTDLFDGRVLVVGGIGPAGVTLASAEIYDAFEGTWTAVAAPEMARSGHTATLLSGGRVLVAGGLGPAAGPLGGAPGTLGDPVAEAEIYDPDSDTWTTAAAMTVPRGRHAAVRIGRTPGPDQVLVCGGFRGGGAVASAEIYHAAADEWRAVPDLATARTGHTATVLSGGHVLVVGGAAAELPLNSCELFDPDAGAWRSAAPMAANRTGHAAVRLAGGQVLVTGGHRGDRPLASTERYDPGANHWTAGSPLAEACAWHQATVLDHGSVLVSGGTSEPSAAIGAGGEIPTTELLDPVGTTTAVAYLEVWRRLVGFLQEDRRESALGGADTTVQLRTVAQVKVVRVPPSHLPDELDCEHAVGYLPDDGAARLSTVVAAATQVSDPCDTAADGGYSGRQNRLYRVEIHDSGEMLGALAPGAVPLAADASGGERELKVGELTAVQRAALLVGSWELVDKSAFLEEREVVSIAEVDATGRVRLRTPVRRGFYRAADGAALVPRRDVARLAEPAAAGALSLRLVVGEGPSPAESAAGRLTRRGWFLRDGQTTEPVAVTSYDQVTGVANLAEPLRTGHGVNAELVPRARYKWSADNAGFATAVTAVLRSDLTAASTTVRVGSLGRDRAGQLRVGDLVEIAGDSDELGPGRGLLCRIAADPDPDTLTVTLDAADPLLVPERGAGIRADHVVLRRWDGVGFVGPEDVDLGEGVKIGFSGYDFRASSYWWFTTRARDASVEALDGVPPHGVRRHRTPLAVLHWRSDDQGGVVLDRVVDCAPVFDPLTGLQARHIAYDPRRTGLGDTVQEAIDALAPQHHARVAQNGISWRNDRTLPLTRLNDGLTVDFTEPMAETTLTDRTVELWLHVPDDDDPLVHAVRVPCVVTPGRRQPPPVGGLRPTGADRVTFRPRTPLDPVRVGQWLGRLRAIQGSPALRVDVVLHSAKILDAARKRPLDGTVFGRLVQQGYDTVTALRLPSGNGRPGGDFESWFFVAAPPAPVRVTRLDPPNREPVDRFPEAVHVMFSKDVLLADVRAAGNVVMRGPNGAALAVRVDPFPFDAAAETCSGITITPTDPKWGGQGKHDLTLSNRIHDVDGLALDGKRDGTSGDFTATYFFLPQTPVGPVPVRVASIRPAGGVTLEQFPAVIRLEFTKLVRLDTLNRQTVEILQTNPDDPLGLGDVEGSMVPFGEARPGLVKGFTFAPADRDSLMSPGLFIVDLRHDHGTVILDEDGLVLAGDNEVQPFSSDFTVRPEQ
ncbi:kelch repeat-containing protein [Kitasatospora sp. CM 4170]|uniref:Kelch repeat-containing protein n=1 Tax=Kitasatospora aburaviensis TaxID=67265 RepID=A0ABW1ESD6_9ACTN|nr:kelch repeat-containing protein [Kitasatospora sp. CM 4170]WNM44583.1 kelch repeat-containing protein [Kitasatospora sp. CM 4170]